jgi:hypothetical protein
MALPEGVPTLEALNPEAQPFGVLIHADAEQATVVPFSGGLAGTLKLKLQTASYAGNELYHDPSNGINGFADAVEESPSGKYLCALALESGVQGELVEAILFRPVLSA